MLVKNILQKNNSESKASWTFLLSVAYLLSGFCALIYQIVWIRKFSLVFGSTVFSMSIVTAVFFGGLAIGSRLFGEISNISKNPVRIYALLEILIGFYALAFPRLLATLEKIYDPIYLQVYDNFVFLVLIRMFITLAVLSLPTLLMGGTLPILAKHFVRKLETAGGQTGWIYGLNAIGAALGSFLTGYVFFRTIGVCNTNILAGAINLLTGLTALAISSRTEPINTTRMEGSNPKYSNETKMECQTTVLIPLAIVCFGISGFVSMAYEVIWLRYILFFFRDTSYLYAGIIGVFILGIGIGSMACGRIVSRVRNPVVLFGFLQMGIGLVTILAIYLPIPWNQAIFQAGERSRGNVLTLLFALLIIPATFMGATFPAVIKIIATELRTVGKQVGKAYALNTAGSILGSLAAGFFFFSFLGLQSTLYILFGMNMMLAAVLLVASRRYISPYWGIIPLCLCFLFPMSLKYSLDSHLPELIVHEISKKEEVLEIGEGITGTTWATRSNHFDSVMLLENRVTFSSTDSISFLAQGHIPLLLTPKIPRSVLGLCFGGGLSHYAGRLYPEIDRFDFVDISKVNIDMALKHFPQNEGLKDDPRARFIIDDAFNFVKYAKRKYDLIISDPNPPTISFRCAALYTREFYKLARERLTDGGYFTQTVPLAHLSYVEIMSVMKTFESVFKNCMLWWNGLDPVMLGSNREFSLDIREISKRLNRPLIQKSLKEYSDVVGYNVLSHFLSGFLLTSEDFKLVAANGTVYTNDLTRLEFSTGKNVNVDSVLRIRTNLSPWIEIIRNYIGFPNSGLDIAQLTNRREYLMGILIDCFESQCYF